MKDHYRTLGVSPGASRRKILRARLRMIKKEHPEKDFNRNLIDKDKMLQYELTKSRAQTVGLEKVCEDFKIRLDRMSSVQQP